MRSRLPWARGRLLHTAGAQWQHSPAPSDHKHTQPVPPPSSWCCCGLLPQFCKYTPGTKFGCHLDGCFVASEDERSVFTLMMYLNGPDDFEGGDTNFLHSELQLGESRAGASKPSIDTVGSSRESP